MASLAGKSGASRFWSGPITRTWSTSGPPSDSTPDRPDGHFSIGQGLKTPNRMHCLFDPVSSHKSPSCILPPSCVIGAVTWSVEKKVQEANADIQKPVSCPPQIGCLFPFFSTPRSSIGPKLPDSLAIMVFGLNHLRH